MRQNCPKCGKYVITSGTCYEPCLLPEAYILELEKSVQTLAGALREIAEDAAGSSADRTIAFRSKGGGSLTMTDDHRLRRSLDEYKALATRYETRIRAAEGHAAKLQGELDTARAQVATLAKALKILSRRCLVTPGANHNPESCWGCISTAALKEAGIEEA